MTRDPIGFAGGIDLYGYCAFGPMGASGLQKFRAGGTTMTAPGALRGVAGEPTPMNPALARAMAAVWTMIGVSGCVVGGAALLIILSGPAERTRTTGRTDGGAGWELAGTPKTDTGPLTPPIVGASRGPSIRFDDEAEIYRIDPLDNSRGHSSDECEELLAELEKKIVDLWDGGEGRLTRNEYARLHREAREWYANCLGGR